MKVVDIARTINPDNKFEIIGCRPGEKIHELMISPEDARCTYEYKDYNEPYFIQSLSGAPIVYRE